MPREQYDLKEGAYQETIAEITTEIDRKLHEEERINDAKTKKDEEQTKKHFKLSERTYGATEKQKDDHERALEVQRQGLERMKQNKRNKLIKEAEEKIEIQIFGKKWGRLEAREQAYASNDPIVVSLKEEKQQFDKLKAAERQNYRLSLENLHKLETLKGKYTEHFNDKDRTR